MLKPQESMLDRNFTLAEPMLQEAAPRKFIGGKLVLSMFLGFSLAALLSGGIRDGVVEQHEPIIAMSAHVPSLASSTTGLRSMSLASSRIQSRTIASAESGSSDLALPSAALKGASAVVTPLLKPFYSLEAPLQAAVTGAVGKTDAEEVRAEIEATVSANPCVIYSYPLSPFCTDAVKLLESTGCNLVVEEPGQEWFLLGPKGSAIRNELGKMTGQTSFPHVFIGGKSMGGLFSGGEGGNGIAGLAESGELMELLQKAGACKAPKKSGGWFR